MSWEWLALPASLVAGAGVWWQLRYGAPDATFFPILSYHKVDPHWEWGGTRNSPRAFARHMRFLAAAGWRTISLNQYINILKSGWIPPKHTFCLTFDDAYSGLSAHALPVLAELGFTCTIFAPSARLGQRNDWELSFGSHFQHMSAEELREVVAQGHEVGSHGRTHIPLTHLSDDKLREELQGSRKELEDATGSAVTTISYPYGACNAHVRQLTKEAGYEGACGSYPPRPTNKADLFELRRLGVYLIDTRRTVRVKVKGSPVWAWASLDLAMRLINRFSVFSQAWRRLKG